MTLLSLISIIYLTIGVLILLLGILIFRENPTRRINRVTGIMMFFASLAPIMGGFGVLIRAYPMALDIDTTILNRLFLIWEFFFPQLLVFSLIFPTKKSIIREFPRITPLLFVPQFVHIIIMLLFRSPEAILSLIRISQGDVHFLLQPLLLMLNIALTLLSYFYEFHTDIFAVINLIYLILAIFIMHHGYEELRNPRQQKQVGLVLWGIRISVGLYVITFLLQRLLPVGISEWLNYGLSILALIIGPGSIALAIIKYQFLNIHLILRRGIIFSITSGLLVGIYLIIYANTKRLVTALLGFDIPVVEVLFLIMAVIMFHPILSSIEETVERFFVDDKSDYRKLLQVLSHEILHIIDTSQLNEKVIQPLKEHLAIQDVFIFIRNKHRIFVPACNPNEEHSPLSFADSGEFISEIKTIYEPVYLKDIISHLSNQAELDALNQCSPALIIPLRHHDDLNGLLMLGRKISGEPFTSEEIMLSNVLADQMSVALENIELYKEIIEKKRIEEDISVAREIQRMLLPHAIPNNPSFEISALNLPSRQVGGDYYDFVELNDHLIGIAIADISGKGISGALLMSNLQATLRAAAYGHESSAEVTSRINRQISRTTSTEKFATFFYGILNTQTRTFTYTNAGHNYPILRQQDGTCQYLTEADLIIGVMEEYPYQQHTIHLQQGDLLVFYTDGITEAINSDKDEFSEQHLLNVVCCHDGSSAENLRDHIYDEVMQFTVGESQYDDITLIVLRVLS